MKRVLAVKDVICAPRQVAPAVQHFTPQTSMPTETADGFHPQTSMPAETDQCFTSPTCMIPFIVEKIFSWRKCGKENKYIYSGC